MLRTITVSNNYLLQINYVTVTYTNYVIDTAANWYDDDHIWMCVRNRSERGGSVVFSWDLLGAFVCQQYNLRTDHSFIRKVGELRS